MPHFFRRLIETVVPEMVISFLFSSPFYFGWMRQNFGNCVALMLLCIIAYTLWLAFCLYGYLCSGYRGAEYYTTNIAVIIILAVISLIFAEFNIEPMFALLFLPFKLLNIAFGLSKVVSALVFSIFLVLITAAMPWINRDMDL